MQSSTLAAHLAPLPRRLGPAGFILFAVAAAACGDDEPDGGSASLAERSREASLARARAQCACESGGYEDIEDCAARFAFGETYNRCNLDAWLAAGLSEASVQCSVAAEEAQSACYAAISGCREEAVQACDDLVDEGLAACDPAFVELPSDDFFDALDACVADEIVGEATGCAPGDPSSSVGPQVFSGSALGAGDDLEPSCETSSSADVELAWTAPATGRYRFTTDGTSAEVALAIYEGCGGSELACDAWMEGEEPNRQSVVELDVEAGETYLVVVDFLFDSTVGEYRVGITAL